MGSNFLPCDRDHLYLLPLALQDWLPEGDLAWVLLDAVAQMDLAAIERTYRADAQEPDAPGSDGTGAADEARTQLVQEARPDGRARASQGRSWL